MGALRFEMPLDILRAHWHLSGRCRVGRGLLGKNQEVEGPAGLWLHPSAVQVTRIQGSSPGSHPPSSVDQQKGPLGPGKRDRQYLTIALELQLLHVSTPNSQSQDVSLSPDVSLL